MRNRKAEGMCQLRSKDDLVACGEPHRSMSGDDGRWLTFGIDRIQWNRRSTVPRKRLLLESLD